MEISNAFCEVTLDNAENVDVDVLDFDRSVEMGFGLSPCMAVLRCVVMRS